MFSPQYTITHQLLANIKHINSLISALNHRHFPGLVLVELEKTAREVSSFASTSIEGNPLPLTEVKKILKTTPAHIRDSEKEVLNYNQTLQTLDQLITTDKAELSSQLILDIHRQTMQGLLPQQEIGSFRLKPVVVHNPQTGQIVYLPPDAQDIKPAISDLISFINQENNRIDTLILAGIFHKQLVLIHPFMDGNGRTTRLATKVLLAAMGLNTFNLFSFENYYNQNVTRYFQTVGETGNYYDIKDRINFTAWLEYFTEGVIDELLRVQKTLPPIIIDPHTELQIYHRQILELIKNKGFIKDRDYKKLTYRARSTRALDFKKLVNLGIITKKGKGKATFYILKEN